MNWLGLELVHSEMEVSTIMMGLTEQSVPADGKAPRFNAIKQR